MDDDQYTWMEEADCGAHPLAGKIFLKPDSERRSMTHSRISIAE
jgi:hypothetical protein